mgnify:CR=1 FL=1
MTPRSRVFPIGDDISVVQGCQLSVSSISEHDTPQVVFSTSRKGVRLGIPGRADPDHESNLAFPVPFGTPVMISQDGRRLAEVVLKRHLKQIRAVEAEVTSHH